MNRIPSSNADGQNNGQPNKLFLLLSSSSRTLTKIHSHKHHVFLTLACYDGYAMDDCNKVN